MTDERRTVTIMRAAELVTVSRRTIYNWLDAGKVEYRRTAGGAVRIYEDSLWRRKPKTDVSGTMMGGSV